MNWRYILFCYNLMLGVISFSTSLAVATLTLFYGGLLTVCTGGGREDHLQNDAKRFMLSSLPMTDPCMYGVYACICQHDPTWLGYIDGKWQAMIMAYIRIRHGLYIYIMFSIFPHEMSITPMSHQTATPGEMGLVRDIKRSLTTAQSSPGIRRATGPWRRTIKGLTSVGDGLNLGGPVVDLYIQFYQGKSWRNHKHYTKKNY